MMKKTKVLLTVDIEHSMGGLFGKSRTKPVAAEKCIFCEYRGRSYGLGLIIETLKEYEIKATFFVETEARHFFGDESLRQLIRYILQNGHDVQLHIHPIFRFFCSSLNKQTDSLCSYSLSEQTKIIKDAKEFLGYCGATDVCAFRAGNFILNADTLRALKENGIYFDSSFNCALRNNYDVQIRGNVSNTVFEAAGLIVFPVTNIVETGFRLNKYRPLQICAISSREFKNAINFYVKNMLFSITILTHPLEMTRSRSSQFTDMVPNAITIRRLRYLCRYLSEIRDKIDITTFSDLKRDYQLDDLKKQIADKNKGITYRSSCFDTGIRYIEQLTQEFYV